jgi:predicted alternative tryptophan synthase beta-subunit
VVSIADDIFRCALYVYASEGVVPAPYTAELMDAAWKVRKS